MNNENKTKLSTKQLVACGILLAVSMVLLYLASVIPGMELTFMAVVGAIVFMVCSNYTFRAGRIFYVASVLLALIVAPGKVIILPYIFCLGPYGLIKYGVEKYSAKFDSAGEKDNHAHNSGATNNGAENNYTKNSSMLNNRVEIRLSGDEEEYVSTADIPPEEIGVQPEDIRDEDANDGEHNFEENKDENVKSNSPKNLKKNFIEYSMKVIGFAACFGICCLFVLLVMGLSPTTVLLNDNILGYESELFAKIGVGLTYTFLILAAIVVFILYDNIIRLINAVFGKYMR